MLFIANALPMNGGSTFLIRICREIVRTSHRPAVLVLFDLVNEELLEELKKWADVVFLSDFSKMTPKFFFKNQAGSFLPINFKKLELFVERYAGIVHVMGFFGLLFLARLIKKKFKFHAITVGVYHQNEFMFEGDERLYFIKKGKEIFSKISPSQVIFFNKSSRNSYENFFQKKYTLSPMLPIGIDMPSEDAARPDSQSRRIVSIGNLHGFKTYNRHIIMSLPVLLKTDAGFSYEIYGDGECLQELQALAKKNGVENAVNFNGGIAYKDIPKFLDGAFAFVGSGTAILEAAALGVPSLIGIESIERPVTYGFLHEIIGFDYNEYVLEMKKKLIIDKLFSLLDGDVWNYVSLSCKNKAKEFSIEKTAAGFLGFEKNNCYLSKNFLCDYSPVKAFISIGTAYIFMPRGIKRFQNRRNQGTLHERK